MNKYKYLFKNIGLLTISNFGTKILSFILIPLYTSILSTEEYGTYDIYSTTVSLLIPVLSLNVVEAVMRFALDEEKNNTAVFTIGIRKVLLSILIFGIIVIINFFTNLIPIFSTYALYLFILFLGSLLYTMMIQFTRGIEKISYVAVAGALNSVIMLLLNVLFLVVFNFGLPGYFAANCIAYLIPVVFLSLKIRAWRYIDLKGFDNNLKNEMYDYCKPLVFNNIAWWVNNVSDRYIVTWICDVASNGIYSVAYKIPSVLNIFQSIFSQAWTISAVKEFDGNSGFFYSRIYKIYNAGMIIVCSGLIVFDKVLAKLLFANDFYIAWQYAPFLMMSVVFGALSGFLGGIFSAAKRSKVFARTTVVGASVNTILNVFLVYFLGPLGAAISTLVSYVLVWASRLFEANKIVKLDIDLKKDILSYFILCVQSVILLMGFNSWIEYVVEILLLIITIVLNFNEFKDILKHFLNRKKNGKKG